MFLKQTTPVLITALFFLIGCQAEVKEQQQSQQVNISPHQVDMKLKTSREVDPEGEEYLNYMKIYNLNTFSFSFQKANEIWSLKYNESWDGKKAY